jgi:ppGpp synthetase/RelA/SpoT-type nucleotidyltranferase
MIVPAAVDAKFRQVQPVVQDVASRVGSMLGEFVEAREYAFIRRCKRAESLAEKLETGRYQRWADLDDLFGCAIIVPTLTEENEVIDFLKEIFRKIEIRGRGSAQKDPSTFRFDTTRFIATLRPTAEREMPDAVTQLRFEIQVRTAYEHAWSVATHRLAYKGDHVEWRRLRLLAHLKAASEQLDHLIIGFDTVSQFFADEHWPEVAAKAAIENRFKSWFDTGEIPREVEPSSWVRFAENLYSLLRATQSKRYVPEDLIEESLNAVEQYLVSNRGEGFPRSLSLLQTVLGILATSGILPQSLRNYYPVVTTQLRTLFPDVQDFDAPFDFEMIGA